MSHFALHTVDAVMEAHNTLGNRFGYCCAQCAAVCRCQVEYFPGQRPVRLTADPVETIEGELNRRGFTIMIE